MIFIAIRNFLKDIFIVEVEEEVPADSDRQKSETAGRSRDGLHEGNKDNKSKVTQLDLSRNEKSSSDSKTDKESSSGHQNNNKSQRTFFKKERQKPGNHSKTAQQKNSPHSYKESTLMNADNMNADNMNAKVHLFEPRVFSETQDIADELKNERATLVNLSKVDAGPKKRIVDFLSGTVYALDGDIQKVGNDIFLCTPKSVAVEGEISSDKENSEEM